MNLESWSNRRWLKIKLTKTKSVKASSSNSLRMSSAIFWSLMMGGTLDNLISGGPISIRHRSHNTPFEGRSALRSFASGVKPGKLLQLIVKFVFWQSSFSDPSAFLIKWMENLANVIGVLNSCKSQIQTSFFLDLEEYPKKNLSSWIWKIGPRNWLLAKFKSGTAQS